MTVRKVFYIILLGMLVLLMVQNMALVTVSFLWWEFTLPRAIILGVTFGFGAIVGLGFFEIRHHQKNKRNHNLRNR